LSNTVNLEPCDYELSMLYRLFEVALLLAEKNMPEAKTKFASITSKFEILSHEHLFHYYYTEGLFSYLQNQYEQCLVPFMKACEIAESDNNPLPVYDKTAKKLYYIVAWCYTYIEIPYRAIRFYYKVMDGADDDVLKNVGLHVDIALAQNYIKINELKLADKLLSSCLIKAQSLGDYQYSGIVLYNKGNLLRKTGDWEKSISFYDQASKYIKEETVYYLSNNFRKIMCMIDSRAFTKAKKLLDSARIKYASDKEWAKYYEALWHYLIVSRRITVRNSESADYLVNIAVPNFEENYDYFYALDILRLLERHYEYIKSSRVSLQITKKIRDIYERCFVNPKEEY